MTVYNRAVSNNPPGKPDDLAQAKERFAAYAGVFIEFEAETKGLDFIDRVEAKHRATEHFQEEHYDY